MSCSTRRYPGFGKALARSLVAGLVYGTLAARLLQGGSVGNAAPATAGSGPGPQLSAESEPIPLRLPGAAVASLDGVWLLATDPQNLGREERWFEAPRPESKPARVPWIIQDSFPAYHGVAWYWRDFVPPANPHPQGRFLLWTFPPRSG